MRADGTKRQLRVEDPGAWSAAQQVRRIEANAFSVIVRRRRNRSENSSLGRLDNSPVQ